MRKEWGSCQLQGGGALGQDAAAQVVDSIRVYDSLRVELLGRPLPYRNSQVRRTQVGVSYQTTPGQQGEPV